MTSGFNKRVIAALRATTEYTETHIEQLDGKRTQHGCVMDPDIEEDCPCVLCDMQRAATEGRRVMWWLVQMGEAREEDK